MARGKKSSKKKDRFISSLDDKEESLLSIILMNRGIISETKLKRIYLEKYTFWELQATEKQLLEKGLLLKKTEVKTNTLDYMIPHEFVGPLLKTFSSKGLRPDKKKLEDVPKIPYGEYSILRYLWQTDAIIRGNLFGPKPSGGNLGLSVRKVEEALGIDWENAIYLVDLLKGLSEFTFLRENEYKKWGKVLDNPYTFVKETFKISYDMMREGNELGRDDFGKDNVDFFFDELRALKTGQWYVFGDFISNARTTLFSANQPFRWIHFDEERVWLMLDSKLKMLGVVETFQEGNRDRYLRLTALGGYCLGEIPEGKFLKKMAVRRGKLLVHPNFEVTLVARELNPKILLELAMISEPIKLDTMSVFRISRESVRKGKQLGLTTTEMIEFLKENSKGEVPQNVEYSVGDWGA